MGRPFIPLRDDAVLPQLEPACHDWQAHLSTRLHGEPADDGLRRRFTPELAIALAGKPRLLFLDEPTAGMSIDEARSTMELVDRLNRELKLTVLFTEHDMGIVFNHARKLTLLHRGEIILQGTPAEVRADATAQKVYLGEHHL